MKKILFVFFLLIILGGTGFFFGWAQLRVPPGSFGVLRTKTHGLDAQVIREGEFRWIWYKLIPTNAAVLVFTVNPVSRAIRSTGALSSGEVYVSLAGLDAVDFSWEISGEIRFNVRPDMLPDLVRRENLRDNADLRKFEETLTFRIETMVLGRLLAYADSEDNRAMEALLLAGSLPELNNQIQRAFPEIENLHCIIRVVRLPDYALYRSVKALHREYLERQNIVLREDILREAQHRIETRLRLGELAQYGDLLTRFPVLLDYLALEKGFPPAGNQ